MQVKICLIATLESITKLSWIQTTSVCLSILSCYLPILIPQLTYSVNSLSGVIVYWFIAIHTYWYLHQNTTWTHWFEISSNTEQSIGYSSRTAMCLLDMSFVPDCFPSIQDALWLSFWITRLSPHCHQTSYGLPGLSPAHAVAPEANCIWSVCSEIWLPWDSGPATPKYSQRLLLVKIHFTNRALQT